MVWSCMRRHDSGCVNYCKKNKKDKWSIDRIENKINIAMRGEEDRVL